MSNFPKFILGDNTDMPDAMFVVHLEYPRFVLIMTRCLFC